PARDPPRQRTQGRGLLRRRYRHRRRADLGTTQAEVRPHRRDRGGHQAGRRAQPGGTMNLTRRSAAVRSLARRAVALAITILLQGSFVLAHADYPSRPDKSWTYSSGESEQLSGPRDLAGRQVMVLTHYYDGILISEDYMEYTP